MEYHLLSYLAKLALVAMFIWEDQRFQEPSRVFSIAFWEQFQSFQAWI
jgi:heme-degrading monooxygenase HmoA